VLRPVRPWWDVVMALWIFELVEQLL
jgi:hypothetical protein